MYLKIISVMELDGTNRALVVTPSGSKGISALAIDPTEGLVCFLFLAGGIYAMVMACVCAFVWVRVSVYVTPWLVNTIYQELKVA